MSSVIFLHCIDDKLHSSPPPACSRVSGRGRIVPDIVFQIRSEILIQMCDRIDRNNVKILVIK